MEIQKMSDQERFVYLINTIAEHKEIWLLQSTEGFFAMFEGGDSQSFIPIWPEKELAQSMACDDWDDYKPERMGLGEFLTWMDELKDDGIFIGAFPYSNHKALAVDPIDLKNQLLQMKGKF